MIDLGMRIDHENDEWWRECLLLSYAQFFHETSTENGSLRIASP